jgi:pimeloyl-ACP methyl ester carboxylesterase
LIGTTTAHIEFRDIKEMYERWTVGERGNYPPTNTAQRAVENLPAKDNWGLPPAPFQYAANTDTNTPYILLVHGWNMETWEKDRYAETAYKRLYWQGYKGRFGFFRWPTGNGFSGSLIDLITDSNNYDKSEWQAWKSAIGLRGLLTNLNAVYPGNIRLLAHSMGNVVAGEALRTSNKLVHTYVAMQAAIPSHAYDGTTPVRTISPSILNNNTPNYYANYWHSNSPPYFTGAAGAANYVNFFNTNDYALVKWQIDQNLKPAGSLGYGYLSSSTTNIFVKGVFSYTYLLFPADTFEIFSFCDESRCFALGAQPSVGGVFQTANEIDLNLAPFSYGTPHKGHSAQFRSNNMKRGVFWSTILEKTLLQP